MGNMNLTLVLFSKQLKKLVRGVISASPNFGAKFKLSDSSPK
jgi:hypothetical protein